MIILSSIIHSVIPVVVLHLPVPHSVFLMAAIPGNRGWAIRLRRVTFVLFGISFNGGLLAIGGILAGGGPASASWLASIQFWLRTLYHDYHSARRYSVLTVPYGIRHIHGASGHCGAAYWRLWRASNFSFGC